VHLDKSKTAERLVNKTRDGISFVPTLSNILHSRLCAYTRAENALPKLSKILSAEYIVLLC
jgi:hypothetical protein